jgi:uncharacterized coiled-coil protein SlyX
MPEPLIETLRRRLEELRERLRVPVIRGQSEIVIGKGAMIERARKTLDEITARVKERKPAIIPAVTEAISKWKPGARIKEILPAAGGTETPSQSEGYKLRE